MQDAPKAVWNIPYISVVFFPSLKHNFIAYRSSKVSSGPDCIFEIHQLSSHKMYSNNIVNVQESTTILNSCTKKVWKPIECTTYLEIFSEKVLKSFRIIILRGFFFYFPFRMHFIISFSPLQFLSPSLLSFSHYLSLFLVIFHDIHTSMNSFHSIFYQWKIPK